MTKWEYSTIPLLTHATKAILDPPPHAVFRRGCERVGEAFEANLAFIAAHTNLTLGGTLHEQHVRFDGRAGQRKATTRVGSPARSARPSNQFSRQSPRAAKRQMSGPTR